MTMICQRPLCVSGGAVDHIVAIGEQRLPVCSACAVLAAVEGFAVTPVESMHDAEKIWGQVDA